jgi:hypothetical protein
MREFFMILAVVAIVAMIPAMYVGAQLAVATGTFLLFPVPELICLVIGYYSLVKAGY